MRLPRPPPSSAFVQACEYCSRAGFAEFNSGSSVKVAINPCRIVDVLRGQVEYLAPLFTLTWRIMEKPPKQCRSKQRVKSRQLERDGRRKLKARRPQTNPSIPTAQPSEQSTAHVVTFMNARFHPGILANAKLGSPRQALSRRKVDTRNHAHTLTPSEH